MDVARRSESRGLPIATRREAFHRQKHAISTGFVVLACLALFASKVAWYDLRIVLPSLQLMMRSFFLIYAACLIPFIALAYGGSGGSRGGWLIWSFHALIAYGWGVCLIGRQADVVFALQDTLKLLFIPTIFFLFMAFPPRRVSVLLDRLAWIIIGYQVIRMLMFVALAPGFFYFGGVVDAFPTCYFLAKLVHGDQRQLSFNLVSFLIALGLVGVGQKRTLLAALAVVILSVLLKSVGPLLRKPSLLFSFMASVTLITVALFYVADLEESRLFERIRGTDLVTLLTEETSRQMEVRDVYDHLHSFGRAAVVFGLGHGATFEREEADHATGESVVHSVHFTPAAMQLRYGFVGIFFYLTLAVIVIFSRSPSPSEFLDSTSLLALRSYALAAVICSVGMFGLVDDMLIGLTIAAFYRAEKLHNASILVRRKKLKRSRLVKRNVA